MPLAGAGVLVLRDASALPVPAPPGVVVVLAPDVREAADEIARILDAACLPPDEARAELERRRREHLAEPVARLAACGERAAAARVAAAHSPAGLRSVPAGLDGAAVRAAARAVSDAVRALDEARGAVGRRPCHDPGAAAAARAAQAEVEQARRDRWSAMPAATRVLLAANLGSGTVVAGRIASESFDRAFVLVPVLPVLALGYAAATVLGPVRRSRAAARRRWAALRSMDVSTLAELAALEQRAAAWRLRAGAVAAAESDLRAARHAWHALVGDAVSLASAGRLAADLDAAAALQAACAVADHAWADAAVALQVAEDTAGTGRPAVVVADPARAVRAGVRRRALDHLAAAAGATTVVVVVDEESVPKRSRPAPAPVPVAALVAPGPVAAAPAAHRPRPLPVRPGPATPHRRRPGARERVIVDIRERVRGGLQRLRARADAAARPRPGSAATRG